MSHNLRVTPLRQFFGRAVRMSRKGLNMTQQELADKSGLHATYIGSVERGERNIGLENIYLIAKSLNLSMTDLLNKQKELSNEYT